MSKRLSFLAIAAVLLFGASGLAFALDQWTGTGEIVDMHCYKKNQAKGEGHHTCAKKCLQGADAEMGLLQADGKVIKLIAGENKAAYQALVDLAGKQAKVTGTLEEGTVTVATSGPAS
jgi:hypothetical protein